MRLQRSIRWLGVILPAAALLIAGCMVKTDRARHEGKGGSNASAGDGHGHPHAGPHEGALAEWGEEEFHAEFTVDHGKKQATVYILDGSAKNAPKVEPKEITSVVLTIKATPPVTIELRSDALKTDAKGIAFSGTHDLLGKEMEFEGTISGKVKDKSFSGDFAEKPHDHKHDKK
jgi:hypothetical protein